MKKMERVKKWLKTGHTMGSMDAIHLRSAQDNCSQDGRQKHAEVTSIKIRQLLEKGQFQKVVDYLRELPRDYVLSCLESFPFIALNKAVPKSFLIWETLLTKLHNSEEGFIPQFPYKACDELMMRVAWLLENSSEEELIHSCKRVLKCVYMQYNEVLERLYKEHDRVQHALYTLGLHSPLGTDPCLALSLEQAIKEEVQASLEDYSTALEQLEVMNQVETTSSSKKGRKFSLDNGERDVSLKQTDMFVAPNPTQVQLHERLYQNQRIFTTLQPNRRSGTLQQLLEFLNERIHGDKEVLSIFGRIRERDSSLTDSSPVQPWLCKYQHALDLAIEALKDIEKDLEITIPRVESPMQFCPTSRDSASNGEEESPQTVPFLYRPRSRSYENEKCSCRRHSAIPTIDTSVAGEEDRMIVAKVSPPKRNLSVPHPSNFRPRSASPHKTMRVVNGVPPPRTGSMKSISSSNDSSINLTNGNSSSVHDLHSTREYPPSLAFTRVQSLKTNKSVQVVAGKRKKSITIPPNSFTNLSTISVSTGSVNNGSQSGKKQKKNFHRSESGELAQTWDRQVYVDGNESTLHQLLETKNNELMVTQKLVQDLRKRERELTDRLSEQAQRHLQDCEKFEDILLGSSRPTLIIQRYKELFSQGRMEALDAIEMVTQELAREKSKRNGSKHQARMPGFSMQLLLDVLTLSYEEASNALDQLHANWKAVLGLSSDEEDRVAVNQLESAVALYLRRVSPKSDLTNIIRNVKLQLSLRHSSSDVFQKVCETDAFASYVRECAQVSWDLCVQTPPMVINYSEEEFNFEIHTRFFQSNATSSVILLYYWPTLLQTPSGPILSRGVVLT